jgi:hypothetical protein
MLIPMRRVVSLFLLFSLPLIFSSAYAQTGLPPDFYQSTFASGFDEPMGMVFDANGRMYLWEKRGLVWIVDTSGQRSSHRLVIE